MDAITAPPVKSAVRRIAHKTRGSGHGAIVRLMSPSDAGQLLKPFVFLDLFEADKSFFARGLPIHPHSGIATITVITEGDVRFDDPNAGSGRIGYGGVEWMRAGGGVWHGKEMSAGFSAGVQGFQLWIALPPELENGSVDSQFIEAEQMPSAGPARVIVGEYEGAHSPVRAPAGVNYLLVTLKANERWRYLPPSGHDVAWTAVARGGLDAGDGIAAGELAVFERGNAAIELQAAPGQDAVFVLGSAVSHPHELSLGYYSVHTSPEALAQGEAKIAEIGARLKAESLHERQGLVPVFR